MRDISMMSLHGMMKPREAMNIASDASSGIKSFVRMSTANNWFMITCSNILIDTSKIIRETMKIPYLDIGLRCAFMAIKYFIIYAAHVIKGT
jgi:hypothetical protein